METGRRQQDCACAWPFAAPRTRSPIRPPVLDDPIAVRLVGPGYANDMERAMHTVARDFRAFMAARSRYAEDQLAEAVAAGVRQYVVLGAGLDTFAYRNPFPSLRVFEVDFPATQEWKRSMLAEAGIAVPENLTFVPLDFEHKTLAEGSRGRIGLYLRRHFRLAGRGALSHAGGISSDAGNGCAIACRLGPDLRLCVPAGIAHGQAPRNL